MAASGELGKEGGARSTTSLTSSSLLLSEGMRHASYAPTQRGNTPWNMATRALGFRPLTLTTMTPSALASPQSSQGGITGKTGGIDGLLSAVSARGGIETPSIGIPSSAPASMEAPLAEAVLHLAMERTQPAGSTPKQGHAPALGFQNVDLWSAAAQSSPEQKQIATAVESIATSVGQLKESHASPTSLSRGPGASMGLALATSLGVASPQPIAHPSASFSGGVLARMEYALNQVGAERILQTNGDENPDLNLGSTSLAPFLDLAHTALSQQKAPGNITESNDAQPHTEWVHPDRQGTQNAERLERVLVSQKEAADVGVSGKATPSQTAPASTSWSNPLSMNGFPGFPSPMASAVGGAAMLSEDKGEPAAASREKAAGDGAGSKTEVDLDALALELANRIKSKLERDAERRGKWR